MTSSKGTNSLIDLGKLDTIVDLDQQPIAPVLRALDLALWWVLRWRISG